VRAWKEWAANIHVILKNCIAHGGAEQRFKNVGKCIRKSLDVTFPLFPEFPIQRETTI
jgi:hypothetical protein